jgi:hypothetical protein
MKPRSVLASLCLLAAFSGCATFSTSELGQVRSSGVSPVVVGKFENSRSLTPPDIIQLTKRGVPDDLIVRQIHDAGVDYLLTRNDVKSLEAARVSPPVMDALIQEANDFAASHAPPGPPRSYAGYGPYPAYPYYDYYDGYPYWGYPLGVGAVGFGLGYGRGYYGHGYYGHRHHGWH